MAVFDKLGSADLAKGVAIGAGLALALPVIAMTMAPVMRPIARSVIKGGLLALEKGRETTAEVGEMVEDLFAEVQEELRETRLARKSGETATEKVKPEADIASVTPITDPDKKAKGQ